MFGEFKGLKYKRELAGTIDSKPPLGKSQTLSVSPETRPISAPPFGLEQRIPNGCRCRRCS